MKFQKKRIKKQWEGTTFSLQLHAMMSTEKKLVTSEIRREWTAKQQYHFAWDWEEIRGLRSDEEAWKEAKWRYQCKRWGLYQELNAAAANSEVSIYRELWANACKRALADQFPYIAYWFCVPDTCEGVCLSLSLSLSIYIYIYIFFFLFRSLCLSMLWRDKKWACRLICGA